MHITYRTYRVHTVVDKRIILGPLGWVGGPPNYWGTDGIWWNTKTDGVAFFKCGPYPYRVNSGKLENKLERLLLDSKQSLWLEWQKSWEIISVEALRKIYWDGAMRQQKLDKPCIRVKGGEKEQLWLVCLLCSEQHRAYIGPNCWRSFKLCLVPSNLCSLRWESFTVIVQRNLQICLTLIWFTLLILFPSHEVSASPVSETVICTSVPFTR